MTHPSKRKGNRVENLVKDIFIGHGFKSIRAYASNGLALGEHEECDLTAEMFGHKWRFQIKARKVIAKWIKPNMENVDAQIIKQDREEPLIVMPLSRFIEELRNARQ